MKRFNKSESDKLFEEIIEKKIVPMLLDYKPFNEMLKYVSTNEMQAHIREIKRISIEEKKQVLEVNNLHKEKARIAKQVLYISNQLNAKGRNEMEDELVDSRNRIIQINEEIDERENSIQELLVQKEEENLNLLRETLSCSYNTIKNDEKELTNLLKEIEELRKVLENKRIQRDELQGRIDSTYGFIHGFMGAKETQKIDEQFL